MALSQENLGRIATVVLQQQLEDCSLHLNAKKINDEVSRNARRFSIAPVEAAELIKAVLTTAYHKSMTTLDAMICEGREEKVG